MQTVNVDIAIVGAGGGGLRAAIAAAEANPNLKIALVYNSLIHFKGENGEKNDRT